MKKAYIAIGVVVVLVLVGLSSIFIVDEREKALVLQFGRVVDVKEDPGIAFKIPVIQEVVKYDDRILSRDIDPLEVTPLDDRRLVVDAFARYRIADVNQFREAVGTGGITAAEVRLDSILRSQTREVLGSVTSNEILSSDRAALMERIRQGAYNEAIGLGVEVIDVRLKRTDLPTENLEATFARMRAEREREAADQIARGNERAQEIRANADRQRVETVSTAQRDAEIVRGAADARRNAVFADAYGADPEFFDFYRSLSAYRNALDGSNSTMVMSPENEFFTYLKNNNPSGAMPAPFDPAALTSAPVVDDSDLSGASLMPAPQTDMSIDESVEETAGPGMDAEDVTIEEEAEGGMPAADPALAGDAAAADSDADAAPETGDDTQTVTQ